MCKALLPRCSCVLTVGALLAMAQAARGADTFTLLGDNIQRLTGDDQLVAPVTSPYYHENSLITSDVRAWYIHHSFNGDSILGSDATADAFAVQLRIALTESLQLVAYKDGYVDFNGDVVDSEGWNDVAAGLKWQFYKDAEANLYAAVGAGYEFSFGESRALQNDSEARVWASVDKGFGKFHTGLTLNGRFTTSDEDRDNGNSNIISWHARADYRLAEEFSPVVEVNGYHILDDSDTGLPLNGADVVNFGATNADPTITAGLGVEFRAGENTAIRGAYEVPLVDDDSSLFGTRFTFSIVYSF